MVLLTLMASSTLEETSAVTRFLMSRNPQRGHQFHEHALLTAQRAPQVALISVEFAVTQTQATEAETALVAVPAGVEVVPLTAPSVVVVVTGKTAPLQLIK
jgi:RNA polymerase-interacting CarD/CdnL/TRCF family regulator